MGRWLRTEDVERAAAMYAAGLSSTAIGEALGVSDHCIRTRLKRAGVKMRPPGKVPAALHADNAYTGGWRRRGLILVPTEPAR